MIVLADKLEEESGEEFFYVTHYLLLLSTLHHKDVPTQDPSIRSYLYIIFETKLLSHYKLSTNCFRYGGRYIFYKHTIISKASEEE